LLDCLTVLLANALGKGRASSETSTLEAMEQQTSALLSAAGSRAGDLIIVTNEVGWGIHPETALGRWYRDGLGIANQRIAAAAVEVIVMVAGLPLTRSEERR